MPTIKGILDVSIETLNGQVLKEYGITRSNKGPLSTSFVLSQTGASFQICFRPIQSLFSHLDDYRTVGYHDPYWNLAAHIYIDKSENTEREVIIKLPQKGVRPANTIAQGRPAVGEDGTPMEQPWMFSEIPVEYLMAGLSTGEKLEKAYGGESVEGPNHQTEMGQIKIILHRILQRRVTDQQTDSYMSNTEDPGCVGHDVSHVVGVGEAKPSEDIYWEVDYLDRIENPWASMIFMYRGKKSLQKIGLISQDDPVLGVSSLSSLNRQLGKRGYQNVNFIDTLTARTPAMEPVSKKLKQDISGGGGRAAPVGSFPKIASATGNKVFRAGSLPKLDGRTIASFRTASSLRTKNSKQNDSSGGDAELLHSFSKVAIRAKKNLIRKGIKDHSKQPNDTQSGNNTRVDSSASNPMWVRQYSTRSSTRLQQASEWAFLEEFEKDAPVGDVPMNSEELKNGEEGKDGVLEFGAGGTSA
ncbi:uncharacterized protein LAJ45_06451 [Morchella importuna]|uniref:uncharacterized protein n=1 Tax=Morchella importuna TaxID=1174673 RepID=UPI001E8CC7E4|nr:uncharacterized protein LAJ45_06451 [Morchella importuna]KAH8149372.1 hypothetical protein LAJ45_06451 [Morchella importuna]